MNKLKREQLRLQTLQAQVQLEQARAQIEMARARMDFARTQAQIVQDFKNSGYSESGASMRKKALKGYHANSSNPQRDIDDNLDTLRQRSRDLWMSSPLATSAIKTNRTNVVGAGLRLKARIDHEYLGLTREQADVWEMNTEREFNLWASSLWCDATRVNNFYEQQGLALISWLMNGDGFALLKQMPPTRWMPYGLRIHLFEGDRVSTPPQFGGSGNTAGVAANGNRIYNGVEIDAHGAVAAYYICSQYPNYFADNGITREWKRVEAFGEKTGNPNILHLMEPERCEQYRGVPYLAPVIECLKQITRYTEAELMAAVVTGFFAAFIKQANPTTDLPFDSAIPEEEQADRMDPNSYELSAGSINVLNENEDVAFADPKRPASGFDPFVSAMAKFIGAALEIPQELLTKSFMASYSASRAALLEAWKAFKMRRTWFANDFCQPVYELWLSEAVARGRVNAPGFLNDPAVKAAWCGAEWNGPSPGQIDPVKEVTAAILKIENGFSTREQETIALTGGDWDRNIQQIMRERELMGKLAPAPDTGSSQQQEPVIKNSLTTTFIKELAKNMAKRLTERGEDDVE